jgi:hypothetical protein
MIRAYLDESGHESKDYVLVCGHGGYQKQWAVFVGAWLEALGPQRKRLHMRDLRWDKPYTQKLLARLGTIPDFAGLKRIVGGVRVSDYEDLITGTPLDKLFKGYLVALFVAVTAAVFALPENEQIEIVLEEQHEYESRVGFVLSAIATLPDERMYRKDGKTKLARWAFVPHERTILLDQADYLCYAMLQRCREETSEKARWCAPILGDGKHIGRLFGREEARKSIIDLKEKLGEF